MSPKLGTRTRKALSHMRKRRALLAIATLGVALTAMTGCTARGLTQLDSSVTQVTGSELASFDENTFLADDVEIRIRGSEVIPAGEGENADGELPVLKVTYETTNLTEQDTDAVTEWFTHFRATQAVAENTLTELSVSDTRDSDVSLIPKGSSVETSISYQIMYEDAPVTLVVSDDSSTEIAHVELKTQSE